MQYNAKRNRIIALAIVIVSAILIGLYSYSPKPQFAKTYYDVSVEAESFTGIPAPICLALLASATQEGTNVDSTFNPFRLKENGELVKYTNLASALHNYAIALSIKAELPKHSSIPTWCGYLGKLGIVDSASFNNYALELSGLQNFPQHEQSKSSNSNHPSGEETVAN